MLEIQLADALKAPREVVDYLTYCSYRHNRKLSPTITPEQWAKIFGPRTQAMEERFQQEANHGAARNSNEA